MADRNAESLVADAVAALDDLDVPDELRESITRHNRHLVELARKLIASGMDEDAIKSVVNRAMDSYKTELIETILSVREDPGDG